LCTRKAHYAAQQLADKAGVHQRFKRPFFKEFTVEVPQKVEPPLSRLLQRGFHAGLPLGQWYPALASCVSLAVTEKRSKGEIDALAAAYESDLAAPQHEFRKKPGEILLA
jgi:glycine dehydrogenase subunit 1